MIGQIGIDWIRVQTGKDADAIVGNDEFEPPWYKLKSNVSGLASPTVLDNIGPKLINGCDELAAMIVGKSRSDTQAL
ncbi:hypothetical protein EXN61_17375 [Agrobacterium tumefaciens]|uniref:Uncharacterized protein n=1 Tax=Agrobacterium tumefaciens TaxID=358 RepID=A0A546XXV5_AGRTU|nr:hypothetical protein [Agrobacterium tumefaciens]TRB05573.1 hypothetical protein EXN61_17375 [Agrobacterium tumefaciens]